MEIQEKRNDIKEVVHELELVLKNTKESTDIIRLRRAIDVLKNKALTVQVGGKEVTFLSNDIVGFKFYEEEYQYHPPVTVLSEDEQIIEDKYVDTKTVAEYYGVTQETVRDWIKKNIISGHQLGTRGRYLIPREEFEYLKTRRDKSKDETEKVMKDFLGEDYSEDWEIEIEE
ncbi:MAG: helix-turn-helix domain-containing protein [Bacillota bacterium]